MHQSNPTQVKSAGKEMNENSIAKIVLDCAFRVHTELGPGLLESVYETAMHFETTNSGLNVRRQVPIPLSYKA